MSRFRADARLPAAETGCQRREIFGSPALVVSSLKDIEALIGSCFHLLTSWALKVDGPRREDWPWHPL
jgi:hypothetical protein